MPTPFSGTTSVCLKADLKQHQLGFTVGGPLLLPKLYDGRNKSFFFASFQGLATPAQSFLRGVGGLTAAELAGDFSNSRVIPKVSVSAANAPNSPFSGRANEEITNIAPYLKSCRRPNL